MICVDMEKPPGGDENSNSILELYLIPCRYGEAPGRGRELYSGLALTYVFLVDMEKPREGTRTFLTPKISKRVPNK